jgi:hypothetical protein
MPNLPRIPTEHVPSGGNESKLLGERVTGRESPSQGPLSLMQPHGCRQLTPDELSGQQVHYQQPRKSTTTTALALRYDSWPPAFCGHRNRICVGRLTPDKDLGNESSGVNMPDVFILQRTRACSDLTLQLYDIVSFRGIDRRTCPEYGTITYGLPCR